MKKQVNEKSKENKVRKQLRKNEYILKKSRTKTLHVNDMGGYVIVNFRNCIVDGEKYDMSIDDVEEFIKKHFE